MTILDRLFGGGSPSKESSDALFKKGESMIQSGDLASALMFFRQMLKQAESESAGSWKHLLTRPIGVPQAGWDSAASQMRNRLYELLLAVHNGARQRNSQVGGNIYFSAGLHELDVVISIGEMLLESDPNAADLWSELGLAYDNHGYCEKAERCYRRGIELDPRGVFGADAWTNIGVLYMNYARTIHEKDCDGKVHEISIAGLRKEQLFPSKGSLVAVSLNPNSPHWKTAESAFEQALSIRTRIASEDAQFRPDLARAHWNLAQLYSVLVQGSKAIPHFQAVYRLEPNNQKAIDWLKEAERNTGKKLL